MYWGSLWGGLWGSTESATSSLDLPDVVFRSTSATGVLSELATDVSQNTTDLAVNIGSISEASSARMLASGVERSVDFVIDVDNTDAGYLWLYGTQSVRMAAGGIVSLYVNGSSILSHTISSVSATAERYCICVTSEPNPLTTGAGDAWRSEIQIFRLSGGDYETSVVTHAAVSQAQAESRFLASDLIGTNAYSNTCYQLRFGRAFHSSVTTHESFVGALSARTILGESREEPNIPPSSTGLGDDGEFAGPMILMGAVDARQKDLWLVGPLVNDNYNDRLVHDGTRVSSNISWTLADPEQADRYLYTHYLRRRPVHPSVNKAWARVFIQQYRTDGRGTDYVHVSLHSMTQPGPWHKPQASPSKYDFSVSSLALSYSHGSSLTAGEWVTVGSVDLKRDKQGCTYLCLGFRVEESGLSGSTDNQLWVVKSFIVEPYFTSQSSGAFGA